MKSRRQIQAVSAAALGTLASVLAVVVEGRLPQMSLAEQVVATAIGSVVLYCVFAMAETVLTRIYYRRFLGRWYYVTFAETAFKNQNFAVMDIGLNDEGTLKYTVHLYPTLGDLLRRDHSTGTANSEAMDYDARKREVHILYELDLDGSDIGDGGRSRRRGRLRLTHKPDGTLAGRWTSVPDRETVSRGTMFAARPRKFEAKLPSWRELEGDRR